jgi:hypothetical protein
MAAQAARIVENNSGFAETLATGKHFATGADKLVYETNSSNFVLNSDGLRFRAIATS